MADLDDLAQRAIDVITTLARRGGALAGGVAVIVAVVAVSADATGLAALDGGARTTWMVVGGVAVLVAVGAPLLARRRLGTVRNQATALVGEVRTLLSRNAEAHQVGVDTVEATQPTPGRPGPPALTGQAQQFHRLRTIAVQANDLRQLPMAMSAVTTFPGLLALGIVLMIGFGLLGFVFLLIWIL
ncbi:hypothetical protein BH18ACT2_BH18ACT2_21790 [soil metagenome]